MPEFPPASAPAAPQGTLWHNADFMKLWVGETVSIVGTRFSALALQLIAVVSLRATPGQMGILAALDTAPVLLIGLFAGVWIDRHRRRPCRAA
ncbi:MAG: hypothetical protein ACYC5O_11225 [Anaerolineae bacterium]